MAVEHMIPNAGPSSPYRPRSNAPRAVLAGIVMGVVGIAAYKLSQKGMHESDPARSLMGRQELVNPWDNASKHGLNGEVGQFKYRYKTREGHMEDSPPPMNTATYHVKGSKAAEAAKQFQL